MMSSIFVMLLDPELRNTRFERYDGVNEVLVINNKDYELRITPVFMTLDSIVFSTSVSEPHNSFPIERKHIASLNHKLFISSKLEEINGVTADDVISALAYYRKFG